MIHDDTLGIAEQWQFTMACVCTGSHPLLPCIVIRALIAHEVGRTHGELSGVLMLGLEPNGESFGEERNEARSCTLSHTQTLASLAFACAPGPAVCLKFCLYPGFVGAGFLAVGGFQLPADVCA